MRKFHVSLQESLVDLGWKVQVFHILYTELLTVVLCSDPQISLLPKSSLWHLLGCEWSGNTLPVTTFCYLCVWQPFPTCYVSSTWLMKTHTVQLKRRSRTLPWYLQPSSFQTSMQALLDCNHQQTRHRSIELNGWPYYSDIRPPNFDILSGAHKTCRYRCSRISR